MRFISVTKPGIILGNVITLSGGFFLASQITSFSILLYLFTAIGMALVMAGSCVLNNIIDRDIDGLMERTKNRELVIGLISPATAYIYAIILGAIGSLILYYLVNPLASYIALFGAFVYVVLYSCYAKRHSHFGTEIGAIAGAMPPVVGYCAVSQQIDLGAWLVFFILFCWQMPHSYAIAIFRLKDYQAAHIPVLPLRKTIYFTKISSLLYTVAFLVAAIMPALLGYAGKIYFVFALLASLYWIYIALIGMKTDNHQQSARKMFGASIIIITLLSIVMIVPV